MFAKAGTGVALISENGAFVVRDGKEISSSVVSAEFSRHVVTSARELARQHNLGLVWSGRSCARSWCAQRAASRHRTVSTG
jgi:hypothetical protein